MNQNFLPELLSALVLIWAAVILWREKEHFSSLLPIRLGVVLLFIARVADVVIQHPSHEIASFLGITRSTFDVAVNAVEDLADAIGILCLVIGFRETVKFEHLEEARIEELEALLPICSNCKKYRTPENVWMPIEHYLTKDGSARLTHGICPDCMKKLYGNLSLPDGSDPSRQQ